MSRPRRFFPPEYKAEVVELIRQTGQTVGQVARGLHLTETAVRQWVKQADQDAGQRIDGLTTVERLHLPAPVHGRNASSSPWSGCIAFRT